MATEFKDFDIRIEKMDDHTSTDKYALIGYFRNKQQQQNKAAAQAATEAVVQENDPLSAVASNPSAQKQLTGKYYNASPDAPFYTQRISHILAESTAEQWLLAFIAFLLFINIICKS